MKSFPVIVVVICCLIGAIRSAAVDPVVAELQKDNTKNVTTDSHLSKNRDCIQPKETGRCFALFYRFAYDVEKDECVEFIYGGCSGNSNNFENKKDCELKCLGKEQNSLDDDELLKTTATPISVTEAATEKIVSS